MQPTPVGMTAVAKKTLWGHEIGFTFADRQEPAMLPFFQFPIPLCPVRGAVALLGVQSS